MKIIFIVFTFAATLILVGCIFILDDSRDNESAFTTEIGGEGTYTSENGEKTSSTNPPSPPCIRIRDGAWEGLELLFESIEDELSRFVAFLEENDLLSEGRIPDRGRHIPFPCEERRFVHSPGWIGRYPELRSILEEIDERNVLRSIVIPQPQAGSPWIRFTIHSDFNIIFTIHPGPGPPIGFEYVVRDGIDRTMFGRRQIRDRWYMFIYLPE